MPPVDGRPPTCPLELPRAKTTGHFPAIRPLADFTKRDCELF